MKSVSGNPAELNSRITELQETVSQLEKQLQECLSGQALKAQEELYRLLADSSQDMITRQKGDGEYIYISPVCEEMLGYKPEELLGKQGLDFVHPEDREKFSAEYRQAKVSGDVFRAEYRRLKKDGSYLWVENAARLIRDPKTGKVKEIVCVIRDISERRAAEDALRASEERFAAFMHHLPGAAYMKDTEGRYLYMNETCERVLSTARGQWENKTDFEILPAETAQEFTVNDRKVLESGEILEAVETTTDESGSHSWLSLKFPMRGPDGETEFVGGISVDITEQKKTENKLVETNELLGTILDSSPVMIAYLDTDFNFVRVNQAYAEGGLKEVSFFTGKNQFDLFPSEKNEAIFKNVFETGVPYYAYARPFIYSERPDWGVLYSDWIMVATKDKAGEINGLLYILLDVTQRKKAEQALAQSEDRYRRLYENTPTMMHSIDTGGRIISVSDFWLERLGYPREEVIGRKSTDFLTPKSKDYAINTVLPEFFRLGYCENIPYQYATKNGEILDILLSAIAEKDDDGKVVRSLAVLEDITERKQAEEKLHFLSSIVEQSREAMICTDKDFRINYINQAAVKLFGWSLAELKGQKPDLLNADPLREEIQRELYETVARGETSITEVLNVRKDGSTFICEFEVSALFDERGEIYGYFGSQRDVTEKRRAEAAARESEEMLRAIFETSLDSIFIKNNELKYIRINRAMEELFDLPREELLGKTDWEVFDKSAGINIKEIDKRVLAGEVIKYDSARQIRGKTLVFDSIKVPLRDSEGKIIGLCGYARDITGRKKMEEALRASEEKFRLVFENLGEGVTRVSLNENIELCNRAAEIIFGVEKGKLLGRNITDFVSDEDLKTIRNQTKKRKAGHRASYEIELIRPGGEIRNLIVTSSPCYDSENKIIGAYSIFRDITENRRAERERKEFELQMQQTQKLESLAVLAGGVAHDYNNLLQGIVGNAGLALMDLPHYSPVRDYIEGIRKSADHAAALTSQMLAFAGRGIFEITSVDISAMIKQMDHLLRAVISKKSVLIFDLQEKIPFIEADTTQIRQIVMNLVTNATEAIGDNEGVIKISTGGRLCDGDFLRSIRSDTELPEGEYIYLQVADTGSGMNEETLRTVFDPFFSTKFTGRGLGMAVVYGIMKRHNGAVKIETKIGSGTCITFYFPRITGSPEISPTASIQKAAGKFSGTALLVDDEEIVRTTSKKILERMGFKVLTAFDGKMGVEVFRDNAEIINLVILDYKMPRMNGEEAFHAIKKIRKDVKVILSSGYNEHDAMNNFGEMGIAGFIQKPYGYKILSDAIGRALGQN